MGQCNSKDGVVVSNSDARNDDSPAMNENPKKSPPTHEVPPKSPANAVLAKTKASSNNNNPLVFISYSWRYRKLDVQKLAKEYLAQQPDFDIWLDIDNMPGDFIYKAMSDAIDKARLVVVFFSRPYPTPDSNSMREFEYALSEGKRLLLVQLDPSYRPEGAFKLAVGSRLYFKFREQFFEEDAATIAKQIRELLAMKAEVSNSTGEQKNFGFTAVNVPFPLGNYRTRPNEEARLSIKLVQICNEPRKGFLLVAGEAGFGKTSLMAEVIKNESSKSFVERLAEPTVIIWLNCLRWRSENNGSLTRFDLEDFEDELLQLAGRADPEFDGFEIASISNFYRKHGERHVLFIFDDLENAELLSFFCQQHSNEMQHFSCCVLTKTTGLFSAMDYFRQEIIEKLPVEYFTNYQQSTTEAALFLQKCFKELEKAEQQAFKGFLLFEAEEQISKDDMHFVGTCLEENLDFDSFCEKLKKLNLVQISKDSGDSRYHFSLHQILFEASFQATAKEFKISSFNSRQKQLSAIRARLMQGASEMILFEFVRQCKLSLLHRVLAGLDCEDLPRIALAQSRNSEKFFIHFLYQFNEWPQRRQFNPEYLSIGKWAEHLSYTLIAKRILLKLKSEDRVDLLHLIAVTAQDFLSELFETKEDGKELIMMYWCARQPLVNVMQPWKFLADNSRWLKKIIAENPEKATIVEQIQKGQTSNLTKDGWILEAAVRCNKLEVLQYLMEGDFGDVELTNGNSGSTLATIAAEQGFLEIVNYLLKKDKSLLLKPDASSRTVLWHAAACGHFELVKFLVDKDSSLVQQDCDESRTPLMAASLNGHLEVVKFVESKEADITRHEDRDGRTPLMLAAGNGHLELVKYFAKKQPEWISRCTKVVESPLLAAAANGHFDVVKFLGDMDAEMIGSPMYNGMFPLWKAAQNGHFQVCRYLARGDPEMVESVTSERTMITPLWVAAENGHTRIVKLLADAKPGIVSEKANSYGKGITALLAAAARGHLEVVEVLAKYDVKLICVADEEGRTPLHASCKGNFLELARFLVDKCPPGEKNQYLSAMDKRGRTAFFLAVENGHVKLVEYLIGVVPNTVLKKNKRFSPAETAEQQGFTEIAAMIKAAAN